ncbi:hypothetical protein Q5H80_00880 [Vibrio sp. SNU_ST1]|uniref:hypothetical protein n=1 Tax=Vibrio sp. SNU_ST1 TaxID=3064001 RepID=UPI00272CD57C|nr:hypothetical protein [Vibrio sp. SNU_ST1]WKY58262.1 hypothetical protein Q5H80_00880 [Vibrio sp. SNU_ST1]
MKNKIREFFVGDDFKNKQLENVVWSLLLMFLTYANLVYSYDLNELDWNYPILYSGDALHVLQMIKMIGTGDWPIYGIPHSSTMGGPFDFVMGDFSGPNTAQYLFIKLFTLFSENVFIVFNSYVVASYFFCSIGMFIFLRKLSISPVIAVGCSLLFSFIPFHFYRTGHVYYINYFYLPFFFYFITKIWDDIPVFYKKHERGAKLDFSLSNLLKIIFILFFSVWNFYYSFFICYFICVITLSACIVHRSLRHLVSGIVLLSTIISGFLISYFPFLYFKYLNGNNPGVANRIAEESRIYSLRISELFSPVQGHPWLVQENLTADYFATGGSLGIATVIGLVFGVLILITKVNTKNIKSRYAILIIAGILLMTYSGLSYLFALYISPSIRGYGRGVIFIALFSLVLLAFLLNDLYSKTSRIKRCILSTSIVLFFCIGLWDISSKNMSFSANEKNIELIESQKVFVGAIQNELRLSASSNVLQLPHMSFPESPRKFRMHSYSNSFVNYFSTDSSIRWTNSAIRGRESDYWITELLKLDIKTQLKILEKSGFSGITIDRFGYEDNGVSIVQSLSDNLGKSYIEDKTRRYVFFKLLAEENSRPRPIIRILNENFWGWEGRWGSFSWAKGNAKLFIPNGTESSLNYRLEFSLTTLVPRTVEFSVMGDLHKLDLIPKQLTPFSSDIEIPPGGIYIDITTDKPAFTVNSSQDKSKDSRKVSFGIFDFKVLKYGVDVNLEPFGYVEEPKLNDDVLNYNFWGWEGGWGNFSWAKGNANLFIPNKSENTVSCELDFSIATLVPREVEFEISGESYKVELIPGRLNQILQTFDVPPGGFGIYMKSNKPPYQVDSKDTRKVSFAISNFELSGSCLDSVN